MPTGTRDYPTEWESDVVLADGGTVHIRPAQPGDETSLAGLYERLSDESLYLRFFSPVPRLTAAQLERLSTIDYMSRMTFVAELGDDIVAVARYDGRVGSEEAEVAFTVQDDQQGRGLGTILLEHLAAVARENGVHRFVASTLPNNSRMLRVFREAGFHVDRAFEDGVVNVAFSIAPTPEAIERQSAREHRSEAESVRRLLSPRAIAVIGAGRHPGTIGHEVFVNLLRGGFTGTVYPVNSQVPAVAGVRAYPSILDVPDDVDLAVITVPAAAVPDTVRECARKHAHGMVIITAGFAETGGGTTEQEIVELARRFGMRLVGPNCMGVVNTNADVSMNATFAPFTPNRGRVSFASQSGALGIELLGQAAERGLGVSTFVSMGNKADVSSNDLLQYWEDDPDTDVILLYLESFGNPRKFARLARRIARTKPIIAVKGGRSGAGSRAAASHTAALAVADVAVDALFHQAGVIRVDTLEQLFDTAQVLALQPAPSGRRVAIVSNGGGPGIIAADACAGAGLEVPELATSVQDTLRSFASPEASVRNPIDLVASATAETYERALRTVLAAPDVDAVLVIFVPPLVTKADDVARAIVEASRDAGPKPIVACFLAQKGVPEPLRGTAGDATGAGGTRSIPSFPFPEAAAVALGRAAAHAEWRRRPTGTVPSLGTFDLEKAHALVATALTDGPDAWLPPEVAADLCTCFGIPVAPLVRAASASDAVAAAASLGFPVAVKAGNANIIHKTDRAAVAIDLADASAVTRAYDEMVAALGADMGGAVVQAMVAPGVEMIAGVTHDPLFGPLVLVGMGGVAAELLRDTTVRILPVTDLEAREMVTSLRGAPLLSGYRGAPTTDVGALTDLLVRLGVLADEIPEVAELDINPVIVSPNGAVAVDVKVRVVAQEASAPAELRRMRPPA